MNCTHEQVRCTNNVFYCLKCGAMVPPPHEQKEETPKRATKRRTKKDE